MLYNFKKTVHDLNGSDAKDENGNPFTAADAAATILMNSPTGGADVMERYNWAMSLKQGGEVDLDNVGKDRFRTFFTNAQNVPLLVRGYILSILETT